MSHALYLVATLRHRINAVNVNVACVTVTVIITHSSNSRKNMEPVTWPSVGSTCSSSHLPVTPVELIRPVAFNFLFKEMEFIECSCIWHYVGDYNYGGEHVLICMYSHVMYVVLDVQLLLSWTPVWVWGRPVLERWWLILALLCKGLLWTGLLSHSSVVYDSCWIAHQLGGVWTAMMSHLPSAVTSPLWPPSQILPTAWLQQLVL